MSPHRNINYEEEKIILNDDNTGVSGEESVAPPSDIVIVDCDESESEKDTTIFDTEQQQNPSNNDKRRPSIGQHHYPPPSISTSPVVTGFEMKMKERLKRGPFMSSSHSSVSFSSPPVVREDKGGSPTPPPTVSSSNNNYEREGSFDENDHHSARSVSSSSLVVCGVDGTVYTLDAYTGQLRGMFASGPALVYSSSPHPEDETVNAAAAFRNEADNSNSNHNNNNMKDDDGFSVISLDNDYLNSAIPNSVKGRKERVVPGLDGRLYSIELEEEIFGDTTTDNERSCDEGDESCSSSGDSNIVPHFGKQTAYKSYNLNELPISAMDVVDSPISYNGQSGIIVGSKKTTIYAIDPTTGKVRWTQDPHGKAGGRGFTTRPPKNTARGTTVLLQREDYAVRHLETDGGEEVWKVELGRFSALDFDVDSDNQDNSSSGASSDDEDIFSSEPPPVTGGKRRGAAATAAAVNSNDKKSSVPPILGVGGRKKSSLHDFESDNRDERHTSDNRKEHLFHHEDSFEHDHHTFRGFPSIAFGEDGTCLVAVDGISGELLWKRRIESVVAATYGVGKDSSWIPLTVEENGAYSNIKCSSTDDHHKAAGLLPSVLSPTSSPTSGGLVPYGAGQKESGGQLHRLGRHNSNLFVSPKLDVGYDAHPEAIDADVDDFLYADNPDTPLPPRAVPNSINHPQRAMADIQPPQSHRTQHGVYLSWTMVAAVIMCLLTGVLFAARLALHRQKRKYENTPSLDPTAPVLSEDGKERSQSSGGVTLPPAANNLMAPLSSNMSIWSKKQLPPTRSYSLGAIPSFSPSRSIAAARPFSDKFGTTLPLPESSATADQLSPRPSTFATTTASPTDASPTIGRSSTLPTETIQPGVDSIDGIPLVRYSRYTSEFKEILPLGRGGFGTVFRCKNNLDEREYAIKKIKILSQVSVDGKVTKRYSHKLHRVLREVKSLALLDHPNIVRYYTAWLEVDNGEDEDETVTTGSIFDRKSQGLFSTSLFSGFGSKSKATFSPNRGQQQQTKKGSSSGSYNPLGWNNWRSFRLEEKSEASSSAGGQKVKPSNGFYDEDDLGFMWERSNDDTTATEPSPPMKADKKPPSELQKNIVKEENESSSGISSIDSKESGDERTSVSLSKDTKKTVRLLEPVKDTDCEKTTTEGRHVLFIQMQLCSIQTLADFLSNKKERSLGSIQKSSSHPDYAVDIPFALRLFAQIAHGVKYVHKQGLIHRDLKPQNCFIDDAGSVKVGDFGLSRESSAAGVISDELDDNNNGKDRSDHDDSFDPADCGDAENTAGVGTRAYASPEQMRGSNYDASTDVYSLGLILFELCYPMYTSMERYKEFGNIRKGSFPAYWISHVKSAFPTMHDILVQMISDTQATRPTASAVSDHVDALLREYSVQSLDKSWGKKGALLLRVEAQERDGILQHTMKIISDAAPNSTILQYGLRGQESKAVMEFALDIKDNNCVKLITSQLKEHDMNVRQISTS